MPAGAWRACRRRGGWPMKRSVYCNRVLRRLLGIHAKFPPYAGAGQEVAGNPSPHEACLQQMARAGALLKSALSLEQELNRTYTRTMNNIDFARLQECRRTVEQSADNYLSAVRCWRMAIQEEMRVCSRRSDQADGIQVLPISLQNHWTTR